MSIVLVYPFRRNTDIGAGSPIGLLYLATYLKKHNFEVNVIDLAGEEGSNDEVMDDIVNKKPALVGFPIYAPLMKTVYDLIVLLKQKGYSGKIVVGAQHATSLPEITLREFHQVDYLIRYEAEVPLTKLAEYLINGNGKLSDIENLYYRNSTIKNTIEVPSINKNIDNLPFPDRSLLNKYYKNGLYNRPYSRGDCDFIICSRGCPFRCNFCFPSASTYRYRSAKNIVDELRYLSKLGRRHIEIMDDTFTVNKKKVVETLRTIIDDNLKLSFKVRSRVELIDEEILTLMKAAGTAMIVFGIESGSDRMLKKMNKKTTIMQNERAIRLTKSAGIACFADLFIGYPGETIQSVEETTNFILKTKPTGINIGVYYPLPLTKGYEDAKKDGSLVGDWSFQHNKTPYVQLDWVENKYQLRYLARNIKRKFYLNPSVLLQTIIFILKNSRFHDLLRIFKIARRNLFPRWRFVK